ncbi:TPA: GNAT family N-acetyltransferase [Enterococcus faecium]|uniref:GNAT family N-acetyltransferase n=2 Tax=Enterococcus faecium TaxID=1352 RepID=UPI000345BB9A|nr:GNAT family N-acetyltransferase [Enterococcus faecium]EME7160161.1 GNAT family N-acetyltransferase [Enterococcus faecium]EME8116264.1 GNAT family N-acetyltransferase [Enterococcus faecium]MCD5211710.1 GNAT family N-acetyltransferase [Enterococcus faecium]MDQ8324163.1 GNAT family N-acetyltransferase [Enterococcus faecium]MDW7923176.1 GNAT family N-acetyltransferase [Enterococcus faecium]
MLREMRLGDAEALREINAEQLGYDVPLTVTVRQMKKLLKEPEKNFFLVYEDPTSKKAAGYVQAESYESIFSDPMFNIMALAVSKHAEKRGIGKALMTGVEEAKRRGISAIRRGISAIRLNSAEYRVEAHRFYERIGYHSDKMQKRFLKIL